MKHTVRAAIGALALIGMGFSLGVMADRLWFSTHTVAVAHDEVRGRLIGDLRETIHLSDDQVASVHEIFSRYQVIVTSAWDDLQPLLDGALDSAFAEINAVLDPDQVEPFHRWFARTHSLPRSLSP